MKEECEKIERLILVGVIKIEEEEDIEIRKKKGK